MKGTTLVQALLANLLIVLLASATAWAGPATEPIRQGEFAEALVDALGWEEGLPAKPAERDYLAILSGKRTFRYEAEDIYDARVDRVTLMNFPVYVPFTGRSWLSGVSTPTPVHFTIMLPLGGKYTFRVVSLGDDQLWSIAGRAFKVNAGPQLKEVEVGTVPLRPGPLEFNVMLPPGGGLDSVTLSDQSLNPVAPLAGWRTSEPLTWGDLAEVEAALLGLQAKLPTDRAGSPPPVDVAAVAKLPAGARTTTDAFLGAFSGKSWIRTGKDPATLEIPLRVPADALYQVRIRCMGNSLKVQLDDSHSFSLAGTPYLEWQDLGLIRLAAGEHRLRVELPANSGIDVVEVAKKSSSPADYQALVGRKGNPAAPVTRGEVFDILVSLAERAPIRK